MFLCDRFESILGAKIRKGLTETVKTCKKPQSSSRRRRNILINDTLHIGLIETLSITLMLYKVLTLRHYSDCLHADSHNANSHNAHCLHTDCQNADCCNSDCQNPDCHIADNQNADCQNADCYNADCQYAD
jgi:hypothetical protein